MRFVRVRHLHCALFLLGVAIAWCAPAMGQRGKPKYKKGEKVEVKSFFNNDEWLPGVVVGISRLGRIEVRLAEPDGPFGRELSDVSRNMPDFARERMLTRSYSEEEVRPLASKSIAKGAPLRKWSDRSGKFSVVARYWGLDGTKVVLERKDGKQISVPLEKLSDGDRAYVKELTDPTENPFGTQSGSDSSSTAMQTKKANWAQVKELRPRKFTKWEFIPAGDSSALSRPFTAGSPAVALQTLPAEGSELESIEGVFPSSTGTRVLVCRQLGYIDKRHYLELIDLSKGKSEWLIPLPELNSLLDADLDAGIILYHSKQERHSHSFDYETMMTVARVDSGMIVPIAQWAAFGGEEMFPKAWLLGSNRVMTLSQLKGFGLIVWEADTAKALMRMAIDPAQHSGTALSPDRKLVAISADNGIATIDLVAGRHVATIPPDGERYHALGFREDNARLAGLSRAGINLWDLTNGRKLGVLTTTFGAGPQSPMEWTGRYLLANRQYLIDVERRILLWEYLGTSVFRTNAALRNGKFWVVPDDRGEQKLTSTSLPHKAALEMAKKLPTAEELLVAKPGDPVAIEVDVDPNLVLTAEVQQFLEKSVESSREESGKDANVIMLSRADETSELIREALAAGLTKAGFMVVDESPIVVKAVCKQLKQQTVRINVDGRWPPRPEDIVERTVTPHATYLAFTRDGEILWKHGSIADAHYNIWLERGETLDQALQRITQPNMSLFTMLKFNSHVTKPGQASDNGAYGMSEFTKGQLVDNVYRSSGNRAFENGKMRD